MRLSGGKMLSELVLKAKHGDIGFPTLSGKEAMSIFSGFKINTDSEILANTLALINKYDEGYKFPTYFNPNIVVYSPSLVKHVLFDEYDKFDRGGKAWERMRYLFGNSSTTCSGKDWERKRNHLKHGFTKNNIEGYIKLISQEIIPPLLRRWEVYANKGIRFNLTSEIYDVTLATSLICFLGEKLDQGARDIIRETLSLGNLYIRTSAIVNEFYPSYLGVKFNRNIIKVNSILKELLNRNKDLPVTTSVLFHLLAKGKDIKYPEEHLNDKEIIDEIRFFLSTGQITAGSTAVWTVIEMLKHPKCAIDMVTEYDEHLKSGDFSIANLKDINKSRNIIKEVLRLYPPIWQTYRVANSYSEVGKYKFVKGSRITVDLLSLSRNNLYWSNPNLFDPSRFNRNYNKYTYIPFGCGPQSCPASMFVPIEITMIVGALLSRFDIDLSNKSLHAIQPKFKCSLAADDDIKVSVIKKAS